MKSADNTVSVSRRKQFVLFLCVSIADLLKCWDTYSDGFYKILFLARGSLDCEINGEATHLSQKDIAFIRASDQCLFIDEREFGPKEKTGEVLECYAMFIAPEVFVDTKHLLGADERFDTFAYANDPLLLSLDTIQCDKIIREMKNFNQPENRRSSDYMNATKLSVASIFYSFIVCTKRSEPRYADAPRWFNDYIEKLEDPRVFILTFAEIIELSGKSREHVSRLFKKTVGVNISDYIISKRINYACVLLKNEELSATQVAAMSGFENIGTFYNNFKKRTGESPERYRKTVVVEVESFKRRQHGK